MELRPEVELTMSAEEVQSEREKELTMSVEEVQSVPEVEVTLFKEEIHHLQQPHPLFQLLARLLTIPYFAGFHPLQSLACR